MESNAKNLPTGNKKRVSQDFKSRNFFRRRSKVEKALEEAYRDWYGSELAHLEVEFHQKPPQQVGDVMQEVMNGLDQDNHILLRKIIGEWEEIVSPEIRFHAMPRRIQKATLFIEVYDSTWRYYLEINFKTEIQKIVQKASEQKIKEIRFIPGGKTRRPNPNKK